jgi:segregation and condensation protein B
MARLEAILFLSREPLGSRKLAQLTGLADGTKARTLVRELNRRYDAEGSAFRVEEVAGGFQLLTRTRYAPWLRRLSSTHVEVRLSAVVMETLAVVAYRQPVLRAEIEAIRGVQCGEVLRQLIERDLVRIAGRSEELGRPLLYGTTRQFLRVFGLRHLEDLPRPDFLPITNLVTEESGEVAGTPKHDLQHLYQSREKQEETDMSITIEKRTTPEFFGTASVTDPERPFQAASTLYAAKADDEEEAEEKEDDDLDDEPWEEVDDEDEDEDDDWDDDEDDDWEEDDDFEEEDDDWEDDDDDFDDDEEEEEAEDEE